MALLDLSALKKAIDAFERGYDAVNNDAMVQKLSVELQETLKAGIIQHFEFTYESAWKFMKRWLETNYGSSVDGVTRRELFRLAAENHLIEDVELWMMFHRARNQTSHTYDKKIATEVYDNAIQFMPAVKKLYQQLHDNNDDKNN